MGTAIAPLTPTNTGGPVVSWSVSPPLPAGLSFNTANGGITGTPTAVTPAAGYTVTATNSGGSSSATITITVNSAAPAIGFGSAAYTFTMGTAIAPLTPTNSGGAVVSWSINPSLLVRA